MRIALIKNTRSGKSGLHSYQRPAETVAIGRCLLVHPDLKWNGHFDKRSWTLTHRPSGFSLRVSICCKRSAVELAKVLKVHDWNFRHAPGAALILPAGFDRKEVEKILSDWICPFGCEVANPVPRPSGQAKKGAQG
jgi:hypothetical protein